MALAITYQVCPSWFWSWQITSFRNFAKRNFDIFPFLKIPMFPGTPAIKITYRIIAIFQTICVMACFMLKGKAAGENHARKR